MLARCIRRCPVEVEAAMTRMLLALGITLALGSAGAGQGRPDFSGTWRLDEPRSVSPTYDGFVGPVVWVIQQTRDLLTVEVKRGSRAFTLTFPLSDTPPGPSRAPTPSYRGYWDNDKLVTESTQDIQGQTVMTREVHTLQANGREMIVERLVQVEHGYTVRGARSY